MSSAFISKTCNHFENITDPRVDRGTNYPLIEMIFVALCATICDGNNWVDVERFGKAKFDWLRKFFPFDNGIPSHDTFGRVFARLDTVAFYTALQGWAEDIAGSIAGHTVAMDGKTLRGSHDASCSKSALHSVSAWVCGLKMCIGIKSVDDKSNEIPAVQQLIDMLDLQGSVVTVDAMHCQKETARKIIDKGANYIMMVKGNQPALAEALHNEIINLIDNDTRCKTTSRQERNRNRNEYRETIVMTVPKGSPVFSQWAGITTIGVIYRSREIDGKLQEDNHTFISSLPCKVRDITDRLRSHWGIENRQHYILDVTFAEDASRIRKGNGPEISSVFRRLALNVLQRDTSIKDNVRGKRKRCAWDNRQLEKLIANFSSV